MPYPVPYWPANTPPGAKTLNLAFYADDGSITGAAGAPNGILFHANRPALLEVISAFPLLVPRGETSLVQLGGGYWNLLDTSAMFGPGADIAGEHATYTFNPRLAASSGVGSAAGGWTVFAHFIPLGSTATQQAVGARLQVNGFTFNAGSLQRPDPNRDDCPFYLDLFPPTTALPVNPSVYVWDTASCPVALTGPGTGTDTFSGENPRFMAFWMSAKTGWSPPSANPPLPSPPTSFTGATTLGTTSPATVNVNSAFADTLNFLSLPPVFRSHRYSSLTVSAATNTQAVLDLPNIDTFSGWDAGTGTYVVPRDGLYLTHGVVSWSSTTDTTQRWAGISVNNTIYWGPGYPNPPITAIGGSTPQTGCITTKTQVFSLRAGDQVQLVCRQNSGSNLNLSSADETRMFLTWLTAPGVPSTLWTVPDTSFRWQAGTAGSALPAQFQAHVANDLGFLTHRPYLMAWQQNAQAGFSDSTWNTATLDTVTGMVHADTGDSYSGWDATNSRYVSQRSGWYLVVAELFSTYPPSPPSSIAAGLRVPTSGGVAPVRFPDRYQQMLASPANFTPGATVVAMYYLSAGESVQPQILGQDYGSTWGTATGTVNGGQVGCHMEVVWLCA